ncbi:dihydrofolate reductase [Bradyrhizobium sp. SSBR45G]|uniref:dihydrofolate reductase n=1 Tax=unclassified Bradyrhizobium TaxID=2631580 RepID=UPI0023429D2C|nr:MULTISPECIES: dihydrofolate reductase [unclassified Bradyrhizobium]GLH79453.1 dihydrofolate reductase [Bradyrhizobium sp. SSBR45G]GLH86830.1 dihydrofolate reductase [Bradyrhizobium sp. SSBR45R]
MIEIVQIVAVAENGVIGAENAIPWRQKSDQKRFRALTMGRPIVMGRKTFMSFPRRPLPGRTNIIVTRDADFRAPGAIVTRTIDEALGIARGDALRRSAAEIAIVGGAEIYAATMPLADRLEITEVHASPPGDTLFPAIDPAQWQEVARERQASGPDDQAEFSYVTYRRRR